jgi:hypothetical protein
MTVKRLPDREHEPVPGSVYEHELVRFLDSLEDR